MKSWELICIDQFVDVINVVSSTVQTEEAVTITLMTGIGKKWE